MENRAHLIILPTFNERENLSSIVERVLEASDDVDILVIDDSSPDGTGDVVREMMEKSDRIQLLQRPKKMGLGSAYVAGFAHALSNGYCGVCTMDADNSHDPVALPTMFKALPGADLVIGSRYTAGGTTNQAHTRKVNSAVANALARVVLDLPVQDCTSGYRLYSTGILRQLRLDTLRSRGYSMLVELLCKVVDSGGKVIEIPIAFRDRSKGQSKIGMHEIWESLRTIARLRRGRFGNIRTKLANKVYSLLPLKNKDR